MHFTAQKPHVMERTLMELSGYLSISKKSYTVLHKATGYSDRHSVQPFIVINV